MVKYVNIKVPKELTDEIDKITDKRLKGYRNRGEFTADAIREKLKEFTGELVSPLEYFNLDEYGVKVLDREIPWVCQVHFKPEKVLCEYCESNKCRHVEFALSIGEVQDILRKKDWKPK